MPADPKPPKTPAATTDPPPPGDGTNSDARVTYHVFEELWTLKLGPTSKDGNPLPPPDLPPEVLKAVGGTGPVKAIVLRGADIGATTRDKATSEVTDKRPKDNRTGTFVPVLSRHAPIARRRKVREETVVHVDYEDVALEVVE